jgi:rRNA maturation RNase YbeY
MSIDIKKTVRGQVPRVSFEKIAAEILGRHYSLSLVICGDTLAQRLNTEYRKKTYKPNVLSFPLSKNEGEIILNIRKAEREARVEGINTQKRLAFLFIHACLHLKGHDHGDTMDTLEQKYMKKAGY